jgi:glycosyltransferase involved in cell wall biosynthesis
VTARATRTGPTLVLVAGKDPLEEPGGGHSAYVRAYARAAVAAGWDPQILCVGPTARTLATDFGTIRRARTPFRPVRQLMIPGHGPVLARALVALAGERDGPVLAHGFGVWGVGAVDGCARLAAQGREAVAVIGSYTTFKVEADSQVRGAEHDPLRNRASYRAQALWAGAVVERHERRAYRAASRVWVNYDAVARLVRDRHGPEVRIEHVPYGPESGFAPLPVPGPVPDDVAALDHPEAPLVVCVARHHARKGVDVLIDALARLRDQGVVVRACLVGFGPLLDAHRAEVRERGLAATVSVPGGVASIDPYLQAADAFVLPSREEQSGALAVLEALRMGLPVVASAVDGIPEDLTDADTGLLVPPGDAAALAAALARLVADEGLRHRLAKAGEALFARRFAPAPFVAGLAAAYSDLGFDPGC